MHSFFSSGKKDVQELTRHFCCASHIIMAISRLVNPNIKKDAVAKRTGWISGKAKDLPAIMITRKKILTITALSYIFTILCQAGPFYV
jgi:hypothetical protein